MKLNGKTCHLLFRYFYSCGDNRFVCISWSKGGEKKNSSWEIQLDFHPKLKLHLCPVGLPEVFHPLRSRLQMSPWWNLVKLVRQGHTKHSSVGMMIWGYIDDKICGWCVWLVGWLYTVKFSIEQTEPTIWCNVVDVHTVRFMLQIWNGPYRAVVPLCN